MVPGGEDVSERMAADPRLPLISATGSTRMGRRVAQVVAARLGRTLLELGGNNGIIVTADADLDLAVRAIVFGAVGTAGQRCTSIRRILVDRRIAADLIARLIAAYKQVRVGDPMNPGTLMGPLIRPEAVERMMEVLKRIASEGGEIVCGGRALGGNFVEPTLVRSRADKPMVNEEIFAPLAHIIKFDSLDEAIAIHNAVP